MSEIKEKEMINKLCFLLGVATSLLDNDIRRTNKDEIKYEWLKIAIENTIYLNKPFPQMP